MAQPKTLSEFFASAAGWGIHCETVEQAERLGRAFNAMGKQWSSRRPYAPTGEASTAVRWKRYADRTVFTNAGTYGTDDSYGIEYVVPYKNFQKEIETIIGIGDRQLFTFIFEKGELK